MILLIGIFNFIGLTISGDFNIKQYILLSILYLIFHKNGSFFILLAITKI